MPDPMKQPDVFARGYQFDCYRLFPDLRCLCRDGKIVHLNPTAMRMLIVLVEHHGQVVTKDDLIERVWFGSLIDENNLATHIGTIRKLLGPTAIKTIFGLGYQFATAVVPFAGALDVSLRQSAAAAAALQTNLPLCVAPIIGRETALAELEDCLECHRLVTITGPGGIGKTRLAIEFARAVSGDFEDGVRWVDLAASNTPADLVGAIASALDITLHDAGSTITGVARAIAGRRLLLVCDNCEHLAGATAAAAKILLETAPRLKILATSQEKFWLAGEAVYHVAPLAVPPPETRCVAGFGAVDLFVARMRAADHRFVLTPSNAEAVAEICRRLEGNALALELAAARVPLLGIEGVRRGLNNLLQLLSGEARGGRTSHLSARELASWSYRLLEPAEGIFFRSLGVFVGGFSLEAATAVAGGDGAELWDVANLLQQLIGKSLISVEGNDRPRYRLLETLRLFALEQLEQQQELQAAAARHASYFAALFEQADTEWEIMSMVSWLDRYQTETDNVRAALEWALAAPERAETAVALAGVAAKLWDAMGRRSSMKPLIGRALALLNLESRPDRAARLIYNGNFFWPYINEVSALNNTEFAIDIYRRSRNHTGFVTAQIALGGQDFLFSRYDEIKSTLVEEEALLSRTGRRVSQCRSLIALGSCAWHMQDFVEARRCFARAGRLMEDLGDLVRGSVCLLNLAEAEFNQGDTESAIRTSCQSIAGIRSIGRPPRLGVALNNLAAYLLHGGRREEARACAGEALSIACAEPGTGTLARDCLQRWALLAALDGGYAEAARLNGFVQADLAAAAQWHTSTEHYVHKEISLLLSANLPAAEAEALAVEGARWSEAEAVGFVLRRYVSSAESPP
jgi:predicted ATPase/DNA-binding winged helix-turn-helix (wHTH) protein